MPGLWDEFLVASLLVVLCVAIHGLGLFSLTAALRSEAGTERLRHITALSPRGFAFTLAMVVAILALHGIEIWLFAFAYVLTGAVENLPDALYFSTISYSTVGYGDALIAHDWRQIGAFESILGIVLIGWSTSFFFRMLGRIEAH